MTFITAAQLRSASGCSAYDIDNWVRFGYLECSIVGDRRQFSHEAIYRAIAMTRLKGFIPPSIAHQFGMALAQLRDWPWRDGKILYFWLGNEGQYQVITDELPPEAAIAMPVSWFEPGRDF